MTEMKKHILSFDIGIKNLGVIHMIREPDLVQLEPLVPSVIAKEKKKKNKGQKKKENATQPETPSEVSNEPETPTPHETTDQNILTEPEKPPHTCLRILDWDVIQLITDGKKVKSQGLDESGTMLLQHLNERWKKLNQPDIELTVLIENQPAMKNPVMKSIQILVYGFFMHKKVLEGGNCNIKFMSASSKLQLGKNLNLDVRTLTKAKSSYVQNKKRGIAYCAYFLRHCINAADWKHVLDDRKKKDDVADCFLQAVYYLSVDTSCMRLCVC